jgi:hypothetical protein
MEDTSNARKDDHAGVGTDDRRQHQRVSASALPGVSAKLPKGPEVVLMDLSRSGARFQCDSRLLPGLSVALRLVTPDGKMDVRGKVVRSRLIRKDSGELSYEIAVAFSELLPEFTGLEDTAPAEPHPPMVQTHADGVSEVDWDEPTLLFVTASVAQPVAALREVFNGNDW